MKFNDSILVKRISHHSECNDRQGENESPPRFLFSLIICHEDLYIEYMLKQNNDLFLRDMMNILFIKVFIIILRCRCSKMGLESFIAAEKSGLHAENGVKREWVMWYKDWTMEDWKCVI